MSLHCNPIIYLNMGGEMLYVLQQRLKAQKINTRKTTIGKKNLFLILYTEKNDAQN